MSRSKLLKDVMTEANVKVIMGKKPYAKGHTKCLRRARATERDGLQGSRTVLEVTRVFYLDDRVFVVINPIKTHQLYTFNEYRFSHVNYALRYQVRVTISSQLLCIAKQFCDL